MFAQRVFIRSSEKAARIDAGTAMVGSIVIPQPGRKSEAMVMIVIQIVSCMLLRTGTSMV